MLHLARTWRYKDQDTIGIEYQLQREENGTPMADVFEELMKMMTEIDA
jgi:hypothetical protein